MRGEAWLSLLSLAGGGRKAGRFVLKVRKPFTGSGRAYQVGDRIDVETVLSWRNGLKMIEQGWFTPAVGQPVTRGVITAQRRAAARKRHEPEQHFAKLVWRAVKRLAAPGTKNVWNLLLTQEIKALVQRQPRLPLVTIREEIHEGGRRRLVYVTDDGRKGEIGRGSFPAYLSRLKKHPPE